MLTGEVMNKSLRMAKAQVSNGNEQLALQPCWYQMHEMKVKLKILLEIHFFKRKRTVNLT